MKDLFPFLKVALADRYELERELGRGGMATVYLGRDLKHSRHVAIKVLRPELAGVMTRGRFVREIRISAELTHPHILPLLDSGTVPSSEGFPSLPYYTMPYIEGESLHQRLAREKQLPVGEALEIARNIADALGYAHDRGVVHRDIKPANILLAEGHAIVADFGIARAVRESVDAEAVTSAGIVIGTPAYMSPEQAGGQTEVDGRSDIYSLGCVLYEMLGGEPPFTGATPQAVIARHRMDPVPSLVTLRSTVPDPVARAIRCSLEKSPADRFSSAGEFGAALRPGPSGSWNTGPTASKPRGRRALIGGLLLVFALLAQVTHYFRQDLVRHPQVGPLLKDVYSRIGWPLSPDWDLAAFELRQWGNGGTPEANGQLAVRASLTNRATFAQPHPILRLELDDRFGDAIAVRDFEPADYLKNADEGARLMGPGASAEAELLLVDPGRDAVGYQLDVCLRESATLLRCAREAG